MTEKISVHEDKFNAVVTLTVAGAKERREAEWIARRYFRDEYGHSPSKIVAQPTDQAFGTDTWEVMVADHSSGSLKGTTEYEL